MLAGLTGCAGSAGSAAACVNPLQPGPLSDGVQLGGATGITVTGPTSVLNAQRSVLEKSDTGADRIVPGGIVTANVDIYDAVSGQLLDQRAAAPHLALPESMVGDVTAALEGEQSDSVSIDALIATALMCATPGETLVVASTAAQSMASQLGLNAAVAVIDVLDAAGPRAEGATRGLPGGFPAVATDETGRPGIVLPPQAAPTTMQVAPRIVGTGNKVTAQSSVIGHALTVSWNGEVVANTWDSGMTAFGTEESANPSYTFRAQLTGYPAGSQVVILDPNDGDPVVHVVDILAVG
ncbi:hypothetical protein [Leucobacter soli]|uniref:hypothetical protein n=1 Tax=Leucobacter soli TaxID=2812850 RepID=UPI003606D789